MFHNMCKMYMEVSQATKNYYDDILINNGMKDLIETKILGTQQTLDNEIENTHVEADDDHDNDITDVFLS